MRDSKIINFIYRVLYDVADLALEIQSNSSARKQLRSSSFTPGTKQFYYPFQPGRRSLAPIPFFSRLPPSPFP
jgi:hypothetical protein